MLGKSSFYLRSTSSYVTRFVLDFRMISKCIHLKENLFLRLSSKNRYSGHFQYLRWNNAYIVRKSFRFPSRSLEKTVLSASLHLITFFFRVLSPYSEFKISFLCLFEPRCFCFTLLQIVRILLRFLVIYIYIFFYLKPLFILL